MELIDGLSLDDVLSERGVMDAREAAAIGAKVMEALGAAHRVGVLHRDVKPGNVLLDRGGRVVLTDFGIAAIDDPGDGSATRLTRSGELVGSLDYLAPERAQGQEPGRASDIWALGATLYAAVEGTAPFRRTSTWTTLSAIVVEPLPEPQRAGALGPLLRQLMDKDPARRPDADTAARLLAAVAAGEDTGTTVMRKAVPPSGPDPAPRTPTELNAMVHRPQGFGPAAVQTPPPSGPTPIPAPAPASPGGTAPESLAGAGRRGRAGVLVASAVVTALLAGGSVTYALVDHGGSDSGDIARSPADIPAASSSTPWEGKAAPSPSGDKASRAPSPRRRATRGPPRPRPSRPRPAATPREAAPAAWPVAARKVRRSAGRPAAPHRGGPPAGQHHRAAVRRAAEARTRSPRATRSAAASTTASSGRGRSRTPPPERRRACSTRARTTSTASRTSAAG